MHEKDCVVELEFLRLLLVDNFNYDVKKVDAANQKRGSYCPDRLMSKIKWGWSIWAWGLGVLLVKYLILYVVHLESKGIRKNKIMSQC